MADPMADPGAVSPRIRMANDIAAQFHHRPPAEAAEEVAHHIRAMSDAEQLPAHGDAVDARFRAS